MSNVLYINNISNFKKPLLKAFDSDTRRVLLIVKLSFDVSVFLLCSLYNTFMKKTIIELEMDTIVLYKDFWYGLRKEEIKEM